MGTPNKYRPEFCDIAAKVLANGESLAAVCAELDISRATFYEWRDNNPDFKDAVDRGLQKAQRVWENIGKDGIIGCYEKFSPSPYIFTMKNRFREDYKEDKQEQKSDDLSVLENILNGKITINK